MNHAPEIEDEPVIAGRQRGDASNQRNFHTACPNIAARFYREEQPGTRTRSFTHVGDLGVSTPGKTVVFSINALCSLPDWGMPADLFGGAAGGLCPTGPRPTGRPYSEPPRLRSDAGGFP